MSEQRDDVLVFHMTLEYIDQEWLAEMIRLAETLAEPKPQTFTTT